MHMQVDPYEWDSAFQNRTADAGSMECLPLLEDFVLGRFDISAEGTRGTLGSPSNVDHGDTADVDDGETFGIGCRCAAVRRVTSVGAGSALSNRRPGTGGLAPLRVLHFRRARWHPGGEGCHGA